MANHALPTATSGYLNFITELNGRLVDSAVMFDPAYTTVTSPPTHTIRFTSAASKWQRWDGAAWVDAATTYAIAISGAAGSAATLVTPRAINGTNFDGSAAITTSLWGTARTITLGSTGKSVNGSANVTWTLAEIGAAAASATLNLTGDQSSAGIKTWTGQQVWGGTLAHTYTNVVGVYTGTFSLGARNFRQLTTGNNIEVVNAANTLVTHTFANDGSFTAAGNITAFSDERLKKDWTLIDGLSLIQGLAWTKAGSYTRTDTGERQIGLSAQSLRLVMPEAVPENADGMLSVAYGNAALVACVALARETIALRERVAALEAK